MFLLAHMLSYLAQPLGSRRAHASWWLMCYLTTTTPVAHLLLVQFLSHDPVARPDPNARPPTPDPIWKTEPEIREDRHRLSCSQSC